MSEPPTIWFVRHVQTDWNAQGRLQGRRDVPLNARGGEQAVAVAARLRETAGEGLAGAAFLSSPLQRARGTMERMRAALGLAPEDYAVDPRFAELGFGSWEGSTWAEIRRWDPSGAFARDRDRWGYRPRGPGAESYAMLAERVGAAVRELSGPTVIVAHGGTARGLLVARGLVHPSAAPRIGVRQGEVLVIETDGWRWA